MERISLGNARLVNYEYKKLVRNRRQRKAVHFLHDFGQILFGIAVLALFLCCAIDFDHTPEKTWMTAFAVIFGTGLVGFVLTKIRMPRKRVSRFIIIDENFISRDSNGQKSSKISSPGLQRYA